MASERGLELARRLWEWAPHSEGQRSWLLSNAKVKIGACGRRWGKSESTAIDIVIDALEKPNTTTIVVAPTADQTTIIMDEVDRRISSVPGLVEGRDYHLKRSPYYEITFADGLRGAANAKNLKTPTQIIARTAGTSGRGLRGRKAHKVVVDEAAFISERIMANVITPLLADYDGQRVEVSTPDGLNHFWEDFERGRKDSDRFEKSGRYESFRFPTSDNPHISADYLENERRTKPEAAYATEYLAEFRSREGTVFRAVLGAVRCRFQEQGEPGHQYVFGVDWGRANDFTVVAVFDVTLRQIVWIERFNEIKWSTQRGRLVALWERFLPVAILAEANSIGEPNIEALQMEGMPVLPFWTSNASKQVIVDDLALAFETNNFGLLDPDKIDAQRYPELHEAARAMRSEIMAYQGKKLPSGLMTYGAPEGQHDDTVIAACLVAHAAADWNQFALTLPASVATAASGLSYFQHR